MSISAEESRCPNCDAESAGPYCPNCGQDNRQPILDARRIARDLVQNLVGWDSALAHTFSGLVRSPGHLVSEYVSGRRRRFINPARFCFISLALWFLVTRTLKVNPMDALGIKITGSSSDSAAQVAAEVREFIGRHLDVLMFLSLPLRALLLRFFFRASGKNLAECLVLVLYVGGFGFILGALLTPLHLLGQVWVVPLRAGLALIWSAWAAHGFFERGWWSTLWRVGFVSVFHILGTVLFFAAVAVPWVWATR